MTQAVVQGALHSHFDERFFRRAEKLSSSEAEQKELRSFVSISVQDAGSDVHCVGQDEVKDQQEFVDKWGGREEGEGGRRQKFIAF